MTDGQNHKLYVGWREWLALPELGIPAIKAKIDTGARTSALHAFTLQPFRANGRLQVRFGIHPLQRRKDIKINCVADVIDQRVVRDSGGHKETRYVIQTPMRMGDHQWPIEISLTNRDSMLFRMLLGRTAMQLHVLVDPGASFLTGRQLARIYRARP
jgi:hypothetical protein